MPPDDNWWARQFVETAKEASQIHDLFMETREIEYLDQANRIYEEWCIEYEVNEISFEEFLDIGKGLRARQASLNRRERL